jgi:AbrB family looped-hinge helix DNA binding protein
MSRNIVLVGKRGQVTLPAKIRSAFGIKEGEPLIIEYDGEKLILRKAMVVPVRIYSDEEVESYIQEDTLKEGERERILKKWKLK